MIEVGQKLWFASAMRPYRQYEVTVTKIGRKWITTDSQMRFDIDTLEADGAGYSSPGKVWTSKALYEDSERMRVAWDKFQSEVSRTWGVPNGVSINDIKIARSALQMSAQDD